MASLQNSTINGYTVRHSGNYANLIDRGNPGSGSPLLLDVLDGAHLYYATNVSSLVLSTQMVANAVYEVQYGTTSSGSNIDILLYPNYTTYSSEFTMKYWASYPSITENVYEFTQTNSYFYFDHQNGGAGTNPKGKWTIFTTSARKSVIYQGGDDNSSCFGTGRWNNGSTEWTYTGTLSGLNTSAQVWAIVRRIA